MEQRRTFIDVQRPFYDVRLYKYSYSSIIDPVGQIVEVDPRIRDFPVVERFCTGFNFNSKGHFLTAGHCLSEENQCSPLNDQIIENCRVSFSYEEGSGYEYLYPISVLERGSCSINYINSESIDYAVLKLDMSASSVYGYIRPLLNYPNFSGSNVVAVSHPNGDPKKITFGKISSFDNKLIDHTARIEPGSSGSPLICQINKGDFFANGVNVSVSVDSNDTQDHEHYYTLAMDQIAGSSNIVTESSYEVVNPHRFFLSPKVEQEELPFERNSANNLSSEF